MRLVYNTLLLILLILVIYLTYNTLGFLYVWLVFDWEWAWDYALIGWVISLLLFVFGAAIREIYKELK